MWRRSTAAVVVLIAQAAGCAATRDEAARRRPREHAGAEAEVVAPHIDLPAARPCASSADCRSGEYCELDGISCGAHGLVPGGCVAIPLGCPAPDGATCGCDGTIYESPCAAATAGVDVSAQAGACKTPEGAFPCGPRFCRLGAEYCERWIAPGQSWACRALPDACKASGAVDCGCFGKWPCPCALADGAFTVSCATE